MQPGDESVKPDEKESIITTVQEPSIPIKKETRVVVEPVKSRITTPSLKDAFQSVNQKPVENNIDSEILSEEEDEPVVLEHEFTEEDLLEKWMIYISNIKSHNPRLHATLKDRKPVLKDDFVIEILLTNTTQKEVFNTNLRQGLLDFLHSELKNNRINISILVEEGSHDKNLLYTSQDKFKYMAEQNPMILKLKQDFDLDFE